MKRLVLVGAGNMGGALLSGWMDAATGFEIAVIDPAPSEAMAAKMAAAGVAHHASADGVAAADILVVAVKPQIVETVLPTLAPVVTGDTVLVSVVAGTPMAKLVAPFSPQPKCVRAMPNTPAMVGQGMTVCLADARVSESERGAVSALMAAVGQVAWIDEEAQMDAVTGVSGSGPAYVFHMAEALTAAGIAAGLPEELAAQLARQTVSGAGALMAASEESPAKLRQNVTSPNGTTQAGLEVLMGGDALTDLMTRTVAAAARRSKELAG